MLGCEILFTREVAGLVQGYVEGGTGKPCPCKVGLECPLFDLSAVDGELVPEPEHRLAG